MFGTLYGIEDNTIIIKLSIDLGKSKNLIGLLLQLVGEKEHIIAEIVDIKDGYAYANLLGEIINNSFEFGVIRKPSFSSRISLLDEKEANKIIGIENYKENNHLYIGKSPIYNNLDIGIDINQFFDSHFAIFGSTGSGKSCALARILQNLFSKRIYSI